MSRSIERRKGRGTKTVRPCSIMAMREKDEVMEEVDVGCGLPARGGRHKEGRCPAPQEKRTEARKARATANRKAKNKRKKDRRAEAENEARAAAAAKKKATEQSKKKKVAPSA
jgi:membrane protein involved in colicin uptake